jgi:alpha-tubulin suppressor-like RCC1 family protein
VSPRTDLGFMRTIQLVRRFQNGVLPSATESGTDSPFSRCLTNVAADKHLFCSALRAQLLDVLAAELRRWTANSRLWKSMSYRVAALLLLNLALLPAFAGCTAGHRSSSPPAEITTIHMGGGHTCAVTTDGTGYCWGTNELGELGVGGAPEVCTVTLYPGRVDSIPCATAPLRVAGRQRWRDIVPGNDHTCGLTQDGAAYCWGLDGSGSHRMLGGKATKQACNRGVPKYDCSPVPVPVRGSHRFVEISTGGGHACALTAEGQAYCWGDAMRGQLGNGSTTSADRPVRVVGELRFRTLAAGNGHTCGITREERLYCWGSNLFGELGNGRYGEDTTVPVAVTEGLRFRSVSTGTENTCAVTVEGALYCWGLNASGQLGTASTETCRWGDASYPCATRPLQVSGNRTWSAVSTRMNVTCGLSEGRAYCWGENRQGLLGAAAADRCQDPAAVALGKVEPFPCSRAPLPVSGPDTFRSISTMWSSTCALTPEGRAYCWGANGVGQLGDGSTARRTEPTPVVQRLSGE